MPGILLATHGAENSDAAVRVAALLAARRHTTLSAVCVIDPVRIVDGGFATSDFPTQDESEAVGESLRAAVNEQLRRLEVSAPLQMRMGPPASEIADLARESSAEAIVLGLGPHHFAERALGHETALQLVQLASTPMLVVPPGISAMPRRALAAIDFSPTSIASARTYAQWLVPGDTLHLVYATGEWRGTYPAEQRANARGALSAVVERLDVPYGVNVEQSVVEGAPAERIFEMATLTKSDVIALGSHGYGFWKRLTLGSVASKIIRLSPIAVYVTPIGCVSHAPVLTTPSVARVGSN
ncbi:MAG TPA: universal stress protein [Gemmatimonadaceae bacterium]|nr:universal stress protein [Gemmatimonadaceae bacterium]